MEKCAPQGWRRISAEEVSEAKEEGQGRRRGTAGRRAARVNVRRSAVRFGLPPLF